MAAPLEWRAEPDLEDFPRELEGDDSRAHRQHVRVVVLPGQPGCVQIVAEGGADAMDLVGGHLLSLAATPDHESAIRLRTGHEPSHLGANRRVVDGRFTVRAAVVDLMAEPLKRADQLLLQFEAGVICADSDSHGRGLYGMPIVTISRRGEERVRGGHPWVYRSDVTDVDAAAGDIAQVVGPRKRPIGYAFFSDHSEIAIRMVASGDEPPGDGFWKVRLAEAIRYRARLSIDATAFRLVHGEADRIPSLIVDRYGDYLVVQALSQAVDRHLPDITAALVDLAKPQGILARNDPRVRLLEGLEQKVEVLYATVPDGIDVREGAVRYRVDPWHGQKTGLFLDQRENREAAARYARGRLLDAFSYHGGFALALAPTCDSVLAVDISEEAVARIRENAASNGIGNVTARAMNVFDELRELERTGTRFDTIVLDPPAFAKNKASVRKALAGYKEINLRALKLLEPGGFLITCSCSYNISEDAFVDIVSSAALDTHAEIALVEKRTQGRDHPILVAVPETYYLKCLILRKLA
jgi:23S rRNA (cytosine1962-C5)-methyltransferase